MFQPERFRTWIQDFSGRKGALWLLFLAGFLEASFFPLSVDMFLITLGIFSPKKSFLYALAAAAGSVAGGYLGYFIGYYLYDALGRHLLGFHGMSEKFSLILGMYRERGIEVLVISGFIPLPYIAFTYAAGFNRTLDLVSLTAGSLIGRLLRFMIVGALLYYAGDRAKQLVEKYFRIAAVAAVILVIAGIILFKWMM